jgi:hypothetical protein
MRRSRVRWWYLIRPVLIFSSAGPCHRSHKHPDRRVEVWNRDRKFFVLRASRRVQIGRRLHRECKANRRNSRHQEIGMKLWLVRMTFASEMVHSTDGDIFGGVPQDHRARRFGWNCIIRQSNLWIPPDKSPTQWLCFRICMPPAPPPTVWICAG